MALTKILTQRSDIAWKEVNDIIILMDLGVAKKVHRLNLVGSFIWKRIDGINTLDTIHRAICTEFDVLEHIARADLLKLVQTLEDLGVLDGS